MKLNKLLAALTAAGLMAMIGPAQASISFQFNPLGGGLGVGLINGAGLLDQSPGNTNALNGSGGGGPLAVGTIITDLYQANLGSVQALDTTNLFSNGTNGGFGGANRFFTFVASFTERVVGSSFTFISPGNFNLGNEFVINNGTFKMCAKTVIGNNLTGVGFGCAGSGILSGRITGGDSAQTATVRSTGFPLLDQAGVPAGDDWPGIRTLSSIGSADIVATVTFVDAAYFPDLRIDTKIAINSSLITPYKQVEPSRRFSSGLVTDDTATNIGPVNGLSGPNFIFQSDANNSFEAPEPGALALGGIALAGLALLRSRRKQSV